jgi:metal-responsive CopG/Arc/MetJ family transcriptional regulator
MCVVWLMATRKITFTAPEELADEFASKVPARQRSRYLADALRDKLAERDRELVRACEVANRDPEVRAIEKEFDSMSV